MSQSIPTGYIPWATSEISSKTCPGVRDLTLKSCLGAGNSTTGRDFVKNESETSKNCVDQIFTGENKEDKWNF